MTVNLGEKNVDGLPGTWEDKMAATSLARTCLLVLNHLGRNSSGLEYFECCFRPWRDGGNEPGELVEVTTKDIAPASSAGTTLVFDISCLYYHTYTVHSRVCCEK